MENTHQQLTPEAQHSFIQSVYRHFMKEEPAPASVVVYKESVKLDEEDPGICHASVKIVTNYISEKIHKVHFKARMSKAHRLLPGTMVYT